VRKFILTVIIAAAMAAACAGVPVGPVDHSCPGNPQRGGLGSGCNR
jgi:hypothetical protein